MVFLSPPGLGARLIGSRRPRLRSQRHSRRCVKAVASLGKFNFTPKKFGSRFELKRKRKQLEEETWDWEKKSRADLLYERKGGAISTAAVHTIREIDGEMPDVTCHSYNWKNKSFNEIQITGIPSSVPGFSCDSRVATFAESLLPVQKQTTSSSHRKFITTFQERRIRAI
ncbi:uncharacterized protein LOC113296884 isoform X2 [Papaver somniferum]|uniref:uncharacterized protein LOC113296884 isoform X2 n=1 Tax=Papaver somniferum TaxID=3469 RepID=UPI000E6F7F4F|nr:uncharacterized protein LOC113296884 isoform X2 [Papaver somniferum]